MASLTLILFNTAFAQSLNLEDDTLTSTERRNEIEQAPTLGKEELKAIAGKLFLPTI